MLLDPTAFRASSNCECSSAIKHCFFYAVFSYLIPSYDKLCSMLTTKVLIFLTCSIDICGKNIIHTIKSVVVRSECIGGEIEVKKKSTRGTH